jgi:hypothetical protein
MHGMVLRQLQSSAGCVAGAGAARRHVTSAVAAIARCDDRENERNTKERKKRNGKRGLRGNRRCIAKDTPAESRGRDDDGVYVALHHALSLCLLLRPSVFPLSQ